MDTNVDSNYSVEIFIRFKKQKPSIKYKNSKIKNLEEIFNIKRIEDLEDPKVFNQMVTEILEKETTSSTNLVVMVLNAHTPTANFSIQKILGIQYCQSCW